MPKTILVADDSVTIRRVVELAFHDTEIRVDSVGSGQEALARFEQSPPDLILADVVMPSPDGYELCKAVKASPHPVPVLLLTGSFEPFDIARAQESGADGHLKKPFESRVLLQRVRELMERADAPAIPVAPEVPAPEAEPDPFSAQEVFDDLAALAGAGAPHRGGDEGGTEDPWDLLLGTPAPTPTESAAPAAPADAPADDASFTAMPGASRLTSEEIDAVARAVVARLSDRVIREIAWEVVPDLAEKIVRQRIRELESSDADRAS